MRKAKRKGKTTPATAAASKRGRKGSNSIPSKAEAEVVTPEPVKVDEGTSRVDTDDMDEGVTESICADEEKNVMESEIVEMHEGGNGNVCGDEEKRETASEPVEMGSGGEEVKREVLSEAVKTDEVVGGGDCGEEENREVKSEVVNVVDEKVAEGICSHDEATSQPVKMDEEICEDGNGGKMAVELVKEDEGFKTVCEGDKNMKANETVEGNDEKTSMNILNMEGNESKVEKETVSGSSDALPTKEDTCELKSLTKHEDMKKADRSMGMIFMCNSRTKRDCFHYNVLGMPSNKKEMVAKIYKGMRLFVFDIDLRLLYGIYKAAGPGGFKIEPKAFQSAFPSQVRFAVLEDCLPLPEEKFKAVIKDNYYGKKKFDCQLTPEQVKNLCKLFQVSTREHSAKQAGRLGIHESLALVNRYGIEARHHVQQEVRYPAQSTVKPFPENAGLHERGVSTSAVLSSPLLVSHQYSLPPPSYSYDRLSAPTSHRRDAEAEFQHNGRLIKTGHGHREDVAPTYILQQATQSGESFYSTQSGESFYHMGQPDQYPPSLHQY
ncbi:hypothetical protein Sjap_001788 [Stephania japonica]|uniref:DCD domain-containing protein n=1 Tax=Stephania japonica TaxID=461633 RepID=A0AAP0KM63_9MAGN